MRQYRVYPRQTGKTISLREMERYIHTQQALGNWPEGNFFENGDEAILGLVDTYEAVSRTAHGASTW